MNWERELYVKTYVRDTPEFLAMSWQARCLLLELIRKVDRRGILQVGKHGIRGIALAIRAPVEEIEAPVRELLAEGRLVWNEADGQFLVPNHVRAQGAAESDALRKRRERDRRYESDHPSGRARSSAPDDHASAGPTNAEGAEAAAACDRAVDPGGMSRVSGQPDTVSSASVARHDQKRSDQIRKEEKRSDERERGRDAARPPLTPIPRERLLSDEGRAYAETLSLSDLERVHRDFKNHYLAEGKLSADWEALWRRWCDREVRIQRQERDRGRPRAPVQLDAPEGKRGWSMPPIIRLPRGNVS
jgi:hypothetical protein